MLINDKKWKGIQNIPGRDQFAKSCEKGKANQCLSEHIAKILGVKKNGVSVVSGLTSPVKRIEVLGISKDALLKKLHLSGRGDG